MLLKISEHEKARWHSMDDEKKNHYLSMADYLNKEYGSEEHTLADIDSALAVGA